MKNRGIVWVLVFLFFIGVSSAQVSVNNESIQRSYQGGEMIKGRINISILNEPANSDVTSNYGGNITLIGWLNKEKMEKGKDYNCTTQNCGQTYQGREQISKIAISG